MTETTSASQSANDAAANARTVETVLYAIQDEDYDTVEAGMADNIVWHNVGINSMRGRKRIMKLIHSARDEWASNR